MGAIFVSYRREDSRGETGRLIRDLELHLAPDQLFRDIDNIEPGSDFIESIQSAISACEATIVVIGPKWLEATDRDGKRRLDNSDDYVRLEVAAALKRDIRVIPVLVGNARLPDADELPSDLQSLASRHCLDLSETRWDYDVEQLAAALIRIPGVRALEAAPSMQGKSHSPVAKTGMRMGRFAGVSVLSAMGILFLMAGLIEGQALAFFWAAAFLGGAYWLLHRR